jgi:hypothetical protein
MAQLLDIEYIYRQEDEATLVQTHGPDLKPTMLAQLPTELLQNLREATLALNREATLEVIGRIADRAPEVSEGLRKMVDNFQMGRLRELLGKVE